MSSPAAAPTEGRSSDPDDQGGRRAEHEGRGMPAVQDANQTGPRLDRPTLARIREIEGVEAAFPEMRFPAQIRLGGKEEFTLVQVLAGDVCQSGLVKLRSGACYAAMSRTNWSSAIRSCAGSMRRPRDTAPGTKIEVATLTLDFSLTNLLRMAFSARGAGPAVCPRELRVHGRGRRRAGWASGGRCRSRATS